MREVGSGRGIQMLGCNTHSAKNPTFAWGCDQLIMYCESSAFKFSKVVVLFHVAIVTSKGKPGVSDATATVQALLAGQSMRSDNIRFQHEQESHLVISILENHIRQYQYNHTLFINHLSICAISIRCRYVIIRKDLVLHHSSLY